MHGMGVGAQAAADIDSQIEKVLRGLGNPEPPLQLDDVRELLKLDLGYYSSTDTGLLKETISRMKIAGKQVLARPSILFDVIRKRGLSALYVPDRKRILLDSSEPKLKHRWNEAHEVGHSVIPWHQGFCHGDHAGTLSMSCQQALEAEANFAAGRLLFLQDRFVEEVNSGTLDIASVKQLGKSYGNTITSTLWRGVECHNGYAFGLVSQHPRGAQNNEAALIRYFVQSKTFAACFSDLRPEAVFSDLGSFCRPGRGPIGQEERSFIDDNGQTHTFLVESFFNGYDALTVGVHEKRDSLVLAT